MTKVIVYTYPDCKKCEEIKLKLRVNNIEYEAKPFTTDVQTDMIMKDIFYEPPVIVWSDGRIFSYNDMFNMEMKT